MNSIDLGELLRLVALHEQWLASKDQDGQRLVLENVSVTNAPLQGRILTRAAFSDVRWIRCNLQRAQFGASAIKNMLFEDCDLQEAMIDDCKVERIGFTRSNCRAVEFDSSYLFDLSMDGGDASGASFLRVLLVRASMRSASLRGATFRRAIIEDSDFHGSDLTDVNLSRASIKRSDFRGCVMERCIWERTWLEAVRVAGAHGTPKEFTDVRTENVTLTEEPNQQPLRPGDEAQLESFLRRSRVR